MNAPFKIIPAAKAPPLGRHKSNTVYRFADMEVGDYFECPDDMGSTPSKASNRQNSINACSHAWARRTNSAAKFTTERFAKKDGSRWVGCWRTV